MQKMEAGKIQSIINRKDAPDNVLDWKEKKNLEERTDMIMSKAKEQFENHEEVDLIIQKARELLIKYKNSDYIPVEQLVFEQSGFDDARLLAFCKIIEEKKLKSH
jgi:hypothetical protein